LKGVCELLNICIKVREIKVRENNPKDGVDTHYFGPQNIINKLPEKHTPTYFREIASKSNLRIIEIVLLRYMRGVFPFSHYMIDELLESNVNITDTKKSKSPITVIPYMIENKLLKPMSEELLNKLNYSFEQYKELNYNHNKPIIIPTKKFVESTFNPVVYGQFYFGFKPELSDVERLLNKLQKVVNSLVKGVDVRCYSRFSELMQKIMFEYGCFEGVMESSGEKNHEVRQSIIFPKPKTYNNESLYLNGKYYYIDMISAYPSCMEGIPHSLEKDSEVNYKIKELIQKMFTIVQNLKRQNCKLASTIKFMMNSCFGYSMRKPKYIKTKYSSNVNGKVEEMLPFVAKYSYKKGNEGFVTTVNSFHPHFNHVQFAKSILDTYNKKIEELEKLVKIYYYNIDAFIVNENDYNKLKELGYIGDNLGQFRVESIFIQAVFETPRKWTAITDEGNIYCRPKKLIDKISFEEFKNKFFIQ
jgi:hypothetical protein